MNGAFSLSRLRRELDDAPASLNPSLLQSLFFNRRWPARPEGPPMIGQLSAFALTSAARLVTGARSLWLGCAPARTQRICFANHTSHGDFVLLWASLPPELRARTRPVAGADYWLQGKLRRFVIHRVFRGVLVDRERREPSADPLQPMLDALDQGDSLIIFPEGTRNLE